MSAEVRLGFGAFAVLALAGSSLLFLAQLICGRLLLPVWGGSPGVWNTATVFYQAVLLGGYGYAHWLTRRWSGRVQWGIHAAAMAAALAGLPLVMRGEAGESGEVWGVLRVLWVTVGLPFAVLSATGPLLQAWWASSSRWGGSDPYRLYAFSQAGSFAVLLLYPVAIEPVAGLAEQSRWWSWAWIVWAAGLLGAGWLARPGRLQESPRAEEVRISWKSRGMWMLGGAVPSAHLVGLNGVLSHDVAPVPMLWVIPLSLYLLSYVVAFRRDWERWSRGASRALAIALAAAMWVMLSGAATPLALIVGVHLGAFFLAATVVHGWVGTKRPGVEGLTAFYFWLALGGVTGGAVQALALPLVTDRLVEYPLLLGVFAWWAAEGRKMNGGIWLVTLVMAGVVVWGVSSDAVLRFPKFWAGLGVFGAYAYSKFRPAFAILMLALGWAAAWREPQAGLETLCRERSFYGAHRVAEDETFRYLFHGRTVHGMVRKSGEKKAEPLTYYHREGPIGQLLLDESFESVAVVGLGTGALAAYGEEGQRWDFYEIDPVVVKLAENARWFPFLEQAACEVRVIPGDARRRLAAGGGAGYDLMVLDAYGSDAVPVHLLTREAFQVYASRLKPGGVMVFHLSNLHLDLRAVVEANARALGWRAIFREDEDLFPEDEAKGRYPSRWAVVAPGEFPESLIANDHWAPLPESRRRGAPWTDDHAAIWPILMREN